MNLLTIILAIIVVACHCIAIFWPRKPLTVPLDENGLPVLWCNETEQKKDVACVWWEGDEDTVETNTAHTLPSTLPMSSFSDAVRQMPDQSPVNRRSVA